MTVTSRQIEDTPQYTGFEDRDDATGKVQYRRVWKPGSAFANRQTQAAKIAAARDTFRTNYANWGAATAQQKDAANRQAQRALANLFAYVLGDTSDPGD